METFECCSMSYLMNWNIFNTMYIIDKVCSNHQNLQTFVSVIINKLTHRVYVWYTQHCMDARYLLICVFSMTCPSVTCYITCSSLHPTSFYSFVYSLFCHIISTLPVSDPSVLEIIKL